MNSPIKWLGGKNQAKRKIVPLFPKHKTYVEPFGGAASVLFFKKKSKVEVYNDVNKGLVLFFRAFQNDKEFNKLADSLFLTPSSRVEHTKAKASLEDEVTLYNWFVALTQAFGSDMNTGWGFDSTSTANDAISPTVLARLNRLASLRKKRKRFKDVIVENRDFREIITKYDSKDTLFYLDPPYAPETRRKGTYADELEKRDHKELVKMLLSLKGKAILSGYDTKLYDKLLKNGWGKISFTQVCLVAGRTKGNSLKGTGTVTGDSRQERTECVWVCPKVLKANKGIQLS